MLFATKKETDEPSNAPASDLPPGHPPIEADAKSGGAGEGGGGCPFAKRGNAAPAAAETPGSGAECAAHSGVGGAAAGSGEGRGVVEVTTSGMTHSCLSVHGKVMCEAYLERWRQHRWRDDAFFL